MSMLHKIILISGIIYIVSMITSSHIKLYSLNRYSDILEMIGYITGFICLSTLIINIALGG